MDVHPVHTNVLDTVDTFGLDLVTVSGMMEVSAHVLCIWVEVNN